MAVGKLFWAQMVVFILLAAAPPKIVDGTPQTMCDPAKNLGGYGLDLNNPEMYMPGKTPLVGEGLTAPHAHVLLSPISV